MFDARCSMVDGRAAAGSDGHRSSAIGHRTSNIAQSHDSTCYKNEKAFSAGGKGFFHRLGALR